VLRTKRGGKWASHKEPFSLSFLNYFESVDVALANMDLGFEWTGFLFGLWVWLMAGSHFFYVLATADHWAGGFQALKQVF
jgi:hypothetical protein